MFAHESSRAFSLMVACLGLLFSLSARAESTDYLKEMPTPDKVVAALSGSDRRDLSAKQAGAMYQMRNLIWDLAGERVSRNQLTAEETRLTSLYVARYDAITGAESKTFDPRETQALGATSTRAKWFDARARYEASPDFRGELLTRFFTPPFALASPRSTRRKRIALLRRSLRPNPAPTYPAAKASWPPLGESQRTIWHG